MSETQGFERRSGYHEFATAMRLQADKLDRIALLLEGANNDGFVAKTQDNINELQTWQNIHEALCQAKEKAQNRTLKVWGVLLTCASIGTAVALKLIFG